MLEALFSVSSYRVIEVAAAHPPTCTVFLRNIGGVLENENKEAGVIYFSPSQVRTVFMGGHWRDNLMVDASLPDWGCCERRLGMLMHVLAGCWVLGARCPPGACVRCCWIRRALRYGRDLRDIPSSDGLEYLFVAMRSYCAVAIPRLQESDSDCG